MNDWLAELHGVEDGLRSEARRICGLAGAFSRTGNDAVSGELYSVAESLAEFAETISKAARGKVREDFEHSERMAMGLLSGIVHGVIRAPEKKS